MVTETDLITAFVNTVHRERGEAVEEALATPQDAAAWLRGRGLLGRARLGDAELARAVALREALRTLLLANSGVAVDTAAAWSTLDAVARRARVELRFADGTPRLVPAAAGADGALGRIAAAVHAAIAAGAWERIKACRAPDCGWAFEDRTKNRSRAWCSMRSCGNREKARVFRRRHLGSEPDAHAVETPRGGPA